jgi:hypothetical protein
MKEKATLLSTSVNPVSPTTRQSSSRQQRTTTTANQQQSQNTIFSEGNQKMLEQLEQLRLELRKNQDLYSDERRSLQIDFNNQLLLQERKFKTDILELKSTNNLLEEKLHAKIDELTAKDSEIHRLKLAYQQMNADKQQAVQDTQKLKMDLKSVQQSIQANYRFDSTNKPPTTLSPEKSFVSNVSFGESSNAGMGMTPNNLPNDIESYIKVNDAKYEAKLRAMTNKLEFLKSQLETERKELDETKQHLSNQYQEMEKLKNFYERKHQNLVSESEKKLHEREEQISLNYEKRMIELTTLQKQFQILTSQSHDLKQQQSEFEIKEELLTQTNNRLQLNLLNSQKENENLRKTIESYEEAKSKEFFKENEKLTQETTIKRLDNERNYLKNQLKSEITLKTDLQHMLDENNRLLRDTQQQWSKDVETLKEEKNELLRDLQEKDNSFSLSSRQMENDLQLIQKQNQDLKLGFQKCREALKMEQLSLETMKSDKEKVLQENLNLQKDLQFVREQEQSVHISFQQQLKTLESVIQENLEKFLKEKKILKDELFQSLEANSVLNQQFIDLRNQEIFSEHAMKRKFQLVRVLSLTHLSNKKCQKLKSFSKWFFNISLMKIVSQFKAQMGNVLRSTKEEHEKEKQLEIKKLRNDWQLEKINEIASRLKECEEQKEEEKQEVIRNFTYQIEECKKEQEKLLQETEEDHNFDLQQKQQEIIQQRAKLLDEFERIKETLHKEKEKELSQLTYQFWEIEIPSFKEALLKEFTEQKEKEMSLKEKEFETKTLKLVRNHEIEIDFRLDEEKKRFEEILEKTKDSFFEEKKILVQNNEYLIEKQKKEFISQLQELKDLMLLEKEQTLQLELSKQRTSLHEDYEKQLQELRTLWQEESDEKFAKTKEQFEHEFQEKLTKLQSNFENEKSNALKQEMKKWKLILLENDKSKELEIQKIILQTKKEMELSFEKEKNNYLTMIEIEKNKEKDVYLLKLQEKELHNEKEKMDLFERQKELLEKEKQEFSKHLELSLNEKYNLEFKELLLKKTEEFNHLLNIEQKKFESLKEDFTKQMKQFAKERDSLLRQINSLESGAKIQEENNLQMIENLKLDFAQEKETIFQQNEITKQELHSQHQKEMKEKTDSLSMEWNSMFHRKLKEEKEEMLKNFAEQTSQSQQENEKLIKTFENSLNDLQKEKENLKNEFNRLTNQLQEMEDALYDTKQLLEKEKKEHSIHLWQFLTKLQLMKLKFQKGIQEFDLEAQKRFESMQRQSLQQYQEMAMQFMKSCSFLYEIDEKRQFMLSLMNSFNENEDLKKNKKSIQVIEHEIDKLFSEKESLESTKEILLKEIDSLTLEIKENEEMARRHSQESAMTLNGRVNLAFARKKRRLDNEIERLLELMENKRNQILEIDSKMMDKVKLREEKELTLITLEQKFISMIIQQQKDIYKELMEWGIYSEKTRVICEIMRFPFPPKRYVVLTEQQKHTGVNLSPTSKKLKKQNSIIDLQSADTANREITINDVVQLMEHWKQEDQRHELHNPHKT